jgi:hypothetical protein
VAGWALKNRFAVMQSSGKRREWFKISGNVQSADRLGSSASPNPVRSAISDLRNDQEPGAHAQFPARTDHCFAELLGKLARLAQ